MQKQKRMQFIKSSKFTSKDIHSINAYEYQVHFQNLPIKTCERAKIIAEIASEQRKNMEEDAFQLKYFVQSLERKINNAFKTAKIYLSAKEKQQIKKYIILGLMKEVLIFISYIYKNTKKYQRESELYNSKSKIYFKWDTNKCSSMTGISSLDQQIVDIQFILYVREDGRNKHDLQKKITKVQENEDEKKNVQRFIGHLLGKNPEYVVIKGQSSEFYIMQGITLGKGGFGFVYKGYQISVSENDQITVQQCAIKQCKKGISQYKNNGFSISQQRQDKMVAQIHKICKLKNKQDSKYIIDLREVVEQSDKKYLIYEYCKHNSLKEYSKKEIFNPKQIFQIGFQLIKTIKLIHHQLIENEDEFYKFSKAIPNDRQITDDIDRFSSILDKQSKNKGIIHRDLKLNNILIKQISQSHVKIKVIDWAFSKRTYIDESISKIQCGTAQYHAPQLQERKLYSSKVDIWAFGAIMFELINMKPFYDKNKAGIKKKAEEEIDAMKFDEKIFQKKQIIFWKNVLKKAMKFSQKERSNAIQLFNLFNDFQFYKQWSQEQDFSFQKIVNIHDQFSLSKQLIAKEYCKTLMQSRIMRQSYQLIELICPLLIKHKISNKINLQQRHIAYAKNAIHQVYGGLTMQRAIKSLQKTLNFIHYTCPNIINPQLIQYLIDQCKQYCRQHQ